MSFHYSFRFRNGLLILFLVLQNIWNTRGLDYVTLLVLIPSPRNIHTTTMYVFFSIVKISFLFLPWHFLAVSIPSEVLMYNWFVCLFLRSFSAVKKTSAINKTVHFSFLIRRESCSPSCTKTPHRGWGEAETCPGPNGSLASMRHLSADQ